MEITAREYCKIDAAAELMYALLLDEKTSKSGMQAAISMILDELKMIRMREADRMNEWAPGELEEELTEDYRDVLDLAKRLGPKKPAGERLPDVPDWRETDGAKRQAKDDRLTRIRLTVALHEGESFRQIIDAIKADGISQRTLAGILGVNPGRITEARQGLARPSLRARFCEVLGMEGGAR